MLYHVSPLSFTVLPSVSRTQGQASAMAVLFVVGWHLEKKGVAKAQEKLEDLASACSFMDGWPEAERAATEMIDRYERNLSLKHEEREQRRLGDMMTVMMGVAQQTVMQQMVPDKAASADTALLKGADLSDGHISYCLERLILQCDTM